MAELVHSVSEIGILQPIVVRRVDDGGPLGSGHDAAIATYELVMGERRWRAAQAAGLEHVPAIIRSTHDDDLLRDALLENLHRSQLNPLEEAAAYRQLLDDFGCTQEAVSYTHLDVYKRQLERLLDIADLDGDIEVDIDGDLSLIHI